MKRESKGIKSQDILILMKLITLKGSPFRQVDLSSSLGISQAEIAYSLDRLKFSGLINEDKKKVNKLNSIEFLLHAVKFMFPMEYDAPARGIKVGPSSDMIRKEVKEKLDMDFVIPTLDGENVGFGIKPIYATTGKVVQSDEKVYELVNLVDILRGLGGVRHKKFAETKLRQIILGAN
jgi:translation elongation factor EF-1beta/biotin operon repressor